MRYNVVLESGAPRSTNLFDILRKRTHSVSSLSFFLLAYSCELANRPIGSKESLVTVQKVIHDACAKRYGEIKWFLYYAENSRRRIIIPMKRFTLKIFLAAFFLDAFLCFTPSAFAAPCVAFKNEGFLNYFFDTFEQTEYVNGFLVYHFRLKTPYNDGRPWGSGLVFYDANCGQVGTFPVPFGTQNTAVDANIRNFSVRFASSTHYDIWNDEVNTKENCPACSVDIPTFFGVGTAYNFISFRGLIDGGASTIFSTSLPVYVQATSSPPASPANHPPTLSFPQVASYAAGGIDPNRGFASSTSFGFKIIYTDADNDPPLSMALVVNDGATTTRSTMALDTSAADALHDGNYANGEQYAFSAFFPKGDYQYHFETSGASTTSATSTATTTVTVRLPATDERSFSAGYSNIAFLPGLEASRLYRSDSGCTVGSCERKLWEPTAGSGVEDLFLDDNGTSVSVRDDIYTSGIIDNAYVPLKGNIYKSFLADLERWKNNDHIIADYGIMPYDWRLSLDDVLNRGSQTALGRLYYSGSLGATTTPFIIQELRRLAATSKTGKVSIIAHSNGGLLAKRLTDVLGASEAGRLIDKIIFVAVPQAGTPKAVGALLHGFDQALPIDLFPFALSPKTARAFAKNMPSAYPLLPSARYFTQVDNPVVTFDGTPTLAEFRARYGDAIHSAEGLRNFITDARRLASSSPEDLKYPSVGNAALLSAAESAHGALDAWTPPSGVSLYEIAGWGEDTLAGIEYYEGKEARCSNPVDINTCSSVPVISYRPREVVEGDGTVVVPSALWMATSTGVGKYWVNLREYGGTNFGTTINRKHIDIFEVPQLRTLARDIITNTTSTTLKFISTVQPPADLNDKRLRFLLHSPIDLSATDSAGNRVSSSTSAIPGGRYERYGEVQVISTPKNTPLTLNLNSYASGSLTLDIEELDGSNTVTSSSTIFGVPSATSTKATMSFALGTLQSASSLAVDYDGNGSTDFSLTPKIGDSVTFSNPKQEPTATTTKNTTRTPVSTPASSAPTSSGYGGGDNAPGGARIETPCPTTIAASSVSAYALPCTALVLSTTINARAIVATDTVATSTPPTPRPSDRLSPSVSQPVDASMGNREQPRHILKERSAEAKRPSAKKGVEKLARMKIPVPVVAAQKGIAKGVPVTERIDGTSVSAFAKEDGNQQRASVGSIKGTLFTYWYRVVVEFLGRFIQWLAGVELSPALAKIISKW